MPLSIDPLVTKQKRSKVTGSRCKQVQRLYNKIVSLFQGIADLIPLGKFTDTIILAVSRQPHFALMHRFPSPRSPRSPSAASTWRTSSIFKLTRWTSSLNCSLDTSTIAIPFSTISFSRSFAYRRARRAFAVTVCPLVNVFKCSRRSSCISFMRRSRAKTVGPLRTRPPNCISAPLTPALGISPLNFSRCSSVRAEPNRAKTTIARYSRTSSLIF